MIALALVRSAPVRPCAKCILYSILLIIYMMYRNRKISVINTLYTHEIPVSE